jgi:4-amino-4-deoxy-L-arabinose transferase-like glycosyltransferase
MTRLLRQHLTVPLVLLVTAGVIALCLRRDAGRPIRGFWAVATGAALGVFQLTREEGIWIAPMLLLAGAALLAVTWREGKIKRIETGVLAVLILVASAVPGWGYVQSNPEARAAIYPHSPAFDELRPHLESGPIADKWMETVKHPTDARFYMTGWFIWALRDAIAAGGTRQIRKRFSTSLNDWRSR